MQRQGRFTRKKSRRPAVWLAAIVSVLLLGGIAYWAFTHNNTRTNGEGNVETSDRVAARTTAKLSTEGEGTKVEPSSPVADEPAGMPDTGDVNQTYDLVIRNGRVIDPETQTDREGLNVGIVGGKIEAVTSQPIEGRKLIDASGLIVSPGFIDNLSYDPNPLGVWNKIADGVTTNIAMHGGTSTPVAWYRHYEGERPPVNFGASFFYTEARNTLKIGRYSRATPEQIEKLKEMAVKALENGVLGISFSLEYVPGITAEEVIPLMKVAQQYNVPVYFHGRYSDMEEPGTNIDTMNELIGYARATGAAVHVDHINSTGGTFSMKQSLAMMDKAIAEGLDMTACTYPYDYWGTYLNSARFDEGWQERFRISYEDLQIAGTGERLTKESFAKYRKEGKLAVAYAIPEQDIIDSFGSPHVMIGSDAILEPGHNNHPRASGTFARTIGLYVREQQVMTLMDAIAKQTLLPAQRLEKQAPAMKYKGRLSPGSDADIVLFNFETIRDRSTVEQPDLPSEGIEYVLVGGQVVKDPSSLHKDVRPGIGIKSEFVRVEEAGAAVDWYGLSVPTLEYRGQSYFDIRWLEQKGYTIAWDKQSRQYTAAKGEPEETPAVPPPAPEGELILERGYRMSVGDRSFELISIGEEAFAPVTLLREML
ncbi:MULTISPECIES: amidohydrolase family protein [unclassified Paenibacillus]|uniref:amidohydrolase family protein n=1 Tax=unclassified Paenibacillus TaxID=185978 RepID=UPI001C10615E|nr:MULTISPECIES: amidohydrolase family protein [unclassified Paenibacillus]MBU5441919.1 amidohydrolase family protein [Paenibacillus sp. MSJ-34]CAH0121332.1 Allantoinase [Paenibacillus sp. CECT 9249]